LLAEFEAGLDAVVLLLADQRTQLGFAFERRDELDALGCFGHSYEELGVDFPFDEYAPGCRTDFALIDKDDYGDAVDAGFPSGDFHHGERRLLRGLKDTGAACSDGRSELPRSHDQRIIPGNNLSSDADGFAQSKTQGVCGNGIDVPENFVREAGVIFETSCG